MELIPKKEYCIVELIEGDIFTLVTPSTERGKCWQVKELIKSFGEVTMIKAQRRTGKGFTGESKYFRYLTKIIFLRHG